MLNFASTFVNSLRSSDVLSPTPKKRNLQHTGCKGSAHGHGNYNPPESPSEPCAFERSPSIRKSSKKANGTSSERVSESESLETGQRTPKPSPFQRTSSLRSSRGNLTKKPPVVAPKSKTASISSENFSESDSIDSIDNKTKGSEESSKKQNDVCSRLFNSGTKASEAKTAKMRHLDIFDVDEASWMGGLRRVSEESNISIQKKKTLEPDNTFARSRNGSLRRSSKFENGLKNDHAPKVPPRNHLRLSFRRSKVKCVEYDEVAHMSSDRKFGGFFSAGDKSNCLKDLEVFLRKPKNTEAKSEEHLEKEKQWLDTERVWLMHRGGFAAARKEDGSSSEPGKVTIRLEQSGDVLVVDEDDIEKANPPQFDRAEDLAALRHLNESSVLHTLRQRYATNLIHTYAGCGTLLVVNPMAPLAIYSEKVVALFKGCKSEDMPPHIYSMAQSAYHNMLSSRRDQSVVFLGRSGSGKTYNFRHCVQYLVTAAGTVNNVLNLEKLTAMWTVLESFGTCKTAMNTNATRFTQIFSVDFDQSGAISSASIQILLLEKSRIAKKMEGETTFHIMHWLLWGVEGPLRKELFLDSLSGNESNSLMNLLQKHEDKQRAQQEFIKTCVALNALGVSDGEQKVIFSVLAAIFHLGCAGAVKAGNNNRYQFSNPQSAQRAASLLGTSAEELSRVIFGLASGGMVTPSQPRAPFRTPSPIDKGLEREAVGTEAIEGIAMGLYSEVFNCVANLINRAISANTHTTTSILLVDAPGFQNPATCGRQMGATFEDLCHNYLQERLQLLFHHTNLVAPRDRYLQENIDFTYDENENENLINPLPLVNLLDKTAQNTVIRTSQTDLHEADRRGLLWLLDEESIYPGGSDDSFVERLFTHYGDRDHQLLLRKAPGNNQFILQHLQGTNPVLYSAKGWLKQSRENPVSRAAVGILQESCKEDISKLFVAIRGLGASSFSGSVVGLDGSQSLRRASSIRRTFTGGTAAIKKKSICLQTKFTIDGLVETLRRTKLRFVQCILPQHNAGLCESNGSLLNIKTTSANAEDALLNIPLLRSQIRGAQILDAVRLYKQGYPTFLPLGEFRRKFGILAGDNKVSSPVLDERKAVEDMLLAIDLELSSYRVGLSQVCNALSKTSSMTCPICKATISKMNDIASARSRHIETESLQFGLSVLHAYIRCFECLLHIAYRLELKVWKVTKENKEAFERKKRTIQAEFKNKMGLSVDIPRSGFGTTNDGNMARRFFANPTLSSEITGINEELIRRFGVILRTINSGYDINIHNFEQYCLKTAEWYVGLYNWYYMPISVHKLLIHGPITIQNAILPIGELSEEAQEAKNKDIRKYRQGHTRKISGIKVNEDLFHRLILSSDPYLSGFNCSKIKFRTIDDPDMRSLIVITDEVRKLKEEEEDEAKEEMDEEEEI